MNRKKYGKIYYSFLLNSVLPLLAFSFLILAVGTYSISAAMYQEMGQEMECEALLVRTLMNTNYPGDYELKGEKAFQLYKGDKDITRDFVLLDTIREATGMEVTLFYQDTRILTTIRSTFQGSGGARVIGNSAPQNVLDEVFATGQGRFYKRVIINGATYFAYYLPVFNSDGTVVGMIGMGKNASEVDRMVKESLYPLLAADVIATVIAFFVAFFHAGRFNHAIQKMRHYFAGVSEGNLDETLDESVLKRQDELSEIGYAALSVQRTLRNLIERDPLTDLYNRRSGDRRMDNTLVKARKTREPYTLVIGDIDFFKKINDTYGHDFGDVVLRNVANMMKQHIHGKGYAIRFGGEEFLLIYEKKNLEEARAELETLLEEIREKEHNHNGKSIRITMSFGMACDIDLEVKDILKQADNHLYYAKEHGRNQIISSADISFTSD